VEFARTMRVVGETRLCVTATSSKVWSRQRYKQLVSMNMLRRGALDAVVVGYARPWSNKDANT